MILKMVGYATGIGSAFAMLTIYLSEFFYGQIIVVEPRLYILIPEIIVTVAGISFLLYYGALDIFGGENE